MSGLMMGCPKRVQVFGVEPGTGIGVLSTASNEVPVRMVEGTIGLLLSQGADGQRLRRALEALALRPRSIEEYPGGFRFVRVEGLSSYSEVLAIARLLAGRLEDVAIHIGPAVTVGDDERPAILIDELVVQYDSAVSREKAVSLARSLGATLVRENPYVAGQFLLRLDEKNPADALSASRAASREAGIAFAHPNLVPVVDYRQVIPNDPFFANQWHHNNTGQGGGTVDADIDSAEAWGLSTGSANIIIAVIDGGFDAAHPDLTPNLWANPGEVAGNGIDDDGNGFTDDVNGWDFTDGDNNLANDNHGTAVAGSAAAAGANNQGVTGTCQNCSLMLIRNGATFFNQGLAFGYAQANGAAIITNSWGYTNPPANVTNAINNAANNGRGGLGSVVLFAMANVNQNDCTANDISALPNVVGVSAASNQDRKVTEAAWGNCMEVLGPTHRGYGNGVAFTGTLNIATTDRPGTLGYNNNNPVANCPSAELANRAYTLCFRGTSAATPILAGAVGLVLTASPNLTRVQVQRLLQDTSDQVEDSIANYVDATGFSSPSGGAATHGYGRANAFEALRVVAPTANGGLGGTDIFIRDNRLDWGNTEQPSNVTFEVTRGSIPHWQSVDIKVDAPPFQTPPTTSAQFEAFANENPEAETINKVYVRVHNRGQTTASQVTVKLHWAFAGAGLPALPSDFWSAFPADSADTSSWHPISAQTISNLAYSGTSVASTAQDASQIASFDFVAPSIPSGPHPRHHCLFAVLDSAQDPISAQSRASRVPDFITPRDNNVTHRNVSLQDPSGRSTPFFVHNPFPHPITVILTATTPTGVEISLEGFRFNSPVRLAEGERRVVGIDVTGLSPETYAEVTITQQMFRGERKLVEGGMTYRLGKAQQWRDNRKGNRLKDQGQGDR
ncbi:MAG: S8 family serine peptidase [Myxococcota bacterium]